MARMTNKNIKTIAAAIEAAGFKMLDEAESDLTSHLFQIETSTQTVWIEVHNKMLFNTDCGTDIFEFIQNMK